MSEEKTVYKVANLARTVVTVPEQTIAAIEKRVQEIRAGGAQYSFEDAVSAILMDWAIAQMAQSGAAKELPGH